MSNLAPHPMTLRQLQYVVALADTRSFRRAAEHCHVSQPSLSTQVAQVEQALGAQLFERDRRRVLLTAAGAALIERARKLLLDADDLVEVAARFADPLTGTMRVGLIPTVSPYLLPEVAPALAQKLPRLHLVWSEDKTAPLAQALAAGQLDAALVALGPELGDVEQAIIGEDRFVLALGDAHPLAASARPIAARDLDAVELMLLAEGHCLRDQAIAACGRRRGRHSPFGATSLATLTQMVAAGAGATLLPELALPMENRRGRLRVRRFARPAPGRTLALVWRRGSAVATAAARIAEVMRGCYERLVKSTQ